MKQVLLERVKLLPSCPGVYFFSIKGQVSYIGKSINLRKRVRSYFRDYHERDKLYILMKYLDEIDYITCETDLEAQLLECQKIQELRPIYNAQLKKIPAKLYISFQEKNKVLCLSQKSGIGPFYNRRILEEILGQMEKLYPLKGEDMLSFSYHILPKNLSEEDLGQSQEILRAIFSSVEKCKIFMATLEDKMWEESEKENFLYAAYYKNLKKNFHYIYENIFVKPNFHGNRQVLESKGDKGVRYYLFLQGNLLAKSLEGEGRQDFLERTKTIKAGDLQVPSQYYLDIIYQQRDKTNRGL